MHISPCDQCWVCTDWHMIWGRMGRGGCSALAPALHPPPVNGKESWLLTLKSGSMWSGLIPDAKIRLH